MLAVTIALSLFGIKIKGMNLIRKRDTINRRTIAEIRR
jgi:hypothetical protein